MLLMNRRTKVRQFSEWTVEVFEWRSFTVFGRKLGVRCGPFDIQVFIVPLDGAFGGFVVVIAALVAKKRVVFEGQKSVGKTGRNPQHGFVVSIELNGKMLAVC